MSIHAPSQYSPDQILDAARRAEAEGRHDFAAQLYRHLADHFPHLPEASAAHEALARIGGQQAYGQYPATSVPSPQPSAPPRGRRRNGGSAGHSRAHHAERHGLVEPIRDYLPGRLIAGAAAWVGGVMAILGAVLPIIATLAPGVLSMAPGWTLAWIGEQAVASTGFSSIVTGLALVLLGQVARAILDQANATREMSALARSRAESDAQRDGSEHRPSRH